MFGIQIDDFVHLSSLNFSSSIWSIAFQIENEKDLWNLT